MSADSTATATAATARVEVTRERIAALVGPLEEAMWARNEAFHQRLKAWIPRPLDPDRPWVRLLGMALSVLGLMLSVFLVRVVGSPLAWALELSFLGAFTLFLLLPSLRRALRRFARGSIARGARRLARRLERSAPFTVEHELSGSVLRSRRLTQPPIHLELELRTAGSALLGPDLLILFRKPGSLVPFRIIFADAPLVEALRAALQAGAVPVAPLSQHPPAPP
jgi:hypothetical protein